MRDFIRLASESLDREFDCDRVLVVGNAQRKRSIFLYEKSGRDPVVVARLPGHVDTEARCRVEQEGFRAFADFGVPDIVVPEALGEMPYAGYTCFFQQAVRSRQWQSRIPNWGSRPRKADFLRATDHLIDIYQATQESSGDGTVSCFQHGDFWMGNLGQLGSSLVLYDLEYARVDGEPLYDLFHFSLYYRVALRNRGLVGMEVAEGTYDRGEEQRVFSITQEDIHVAFIDPGPFRDLVGSCINRYCSECMISPETSARLLKRFVEHRIDGNRGIQGFPSDWEQTVTGNH